MTVLVCGLNPSVYAAEHGVPFAGGSNRFWGAAIAAGLVSRPRDPLHALSEHCVGFTDLVKRATVASAELDPSEYEVGIERLERLVRWLRPRVVAFVGLEGWRRARDPRARPGIQPGGVAGSPAYLLPSTSGRNARSRPEDLAAHLREVGALAGLREPALNRGGSVVTRRGAPTRAAAPPAAPR